MRVSFEHHVTFHCLNHMTFHHLIMWLHHLPSPSHDFNMWSSIAFINACREAVVQWPPRSHDTGSRRGAGKVTWLHNSVYHHLCPPGNHGDQFSMLWLYHPHCSPSHITPPHFSPSHITPHTAPPPTSAWLPAVHTKSCQYAGGKRLCATWFGVCCEFYLSHLIYSFTSPSLLAHYPFPLYLLLPSPCCHSSYPTTWFTTRLIELKS